MTGVLDEGFDRTRPSRMRIGTTRTYWTSYATFVKVVKLAG
jgi:hypothetical protein